MVFTGRPSRKCLGCRQRRIKCDLRSPECSQCQRARMKCGGYHDPSSLVFRNENCQAQRLSALARSRPRDARHRKECDDASAKLLAIIIFGASEATCVPPLPALSVEEEGLRFFYETFVSTSAFMLEHRTPYDAKQSLESMKDLLSSPALRDGMIAAGLSALSNVTGNKTYRTIAIQKNTSTIVHARKTFQKLDAREFQYAMRIVLMLGLYELVNNSSHTSAPRRAHANGALALLRQYNNGQLPMAPHNISTMQFFLVLINGYFVAGAIPPEDLMCWRARHAGSQLVCDISMLLEIVIRVVRLHISFKSGLSAPQLSEYYDDIVKKSLILENELDAWSKNLPPDDWHWTTQPSNHFASYYGWSHVYANPWNSRLLNQYRLARIVVNEMLYLCTARLPNSINPHQQRVQQQQKHALATIRQLATDICLSVNSTSIFTEPAKPAKQHSPATSHLPLESYPDLPPLNGIFTVFFPLIIAASAVGVPKETTNWIIKTLHTIGTSMGIGFAMTSITRINKLRGKKGLS